MHLLSTLFYSLALFFGYQSPPAPAPVPAPVPQTLGAVLPSATAVFETSLASPITSSATSLTLTANAVRGGGAIAGYNCFIVDEGSAQAETMCGTVSGTSATSLSRGISQSTGTTTVAALQFAHRRGANVKISDFPVIQILKAQNNGEDTYPNILHYDSHPTFVGTTDLVDKKYVDDTAFSGAGVISATAAAKGVVELATQIESASSTVNGSSGPLVIPASSATSTYNSQTAPLRVVVTQNSGKIDPNFLTLPPVTNVGSTSIVQDSSGVMSWGAYNINLPTDGTYPRAASIASATTTLISATVPAGILGTNGLIHGRIFGKNDFAGSGTKIGVAFGNATTSNPNQSSSVPPMTYSTDQSGPYIMDFYIQNTSATTQTISMFMLASTTTASPNFQVGTTTGAVNSASAQRVIVEISGGAGAVASAFMGMLEVLRK